jgi:flagellar hook-length control protein FliK
MAEQVGSSRPDADAKMASVSEGHADLRQTDERQTDGRDGIAQSDVVGTEVSQGGQKQTSQSEGGDGPSVQTQPAEVAESDPVLATPERVSDKAPAAFAEEGATAKSTSSGVSEQIFDSMRASVARGDSEVTIRLRPPELGSVIVRFQQEGHGEIRGVLEVGKAETRYEIEQALPQVVRGLQDAGVQVRRLEVVVADQPDRDLDKEQLQQDAWSQQQGSDQHGDQPQRWPGNVWASDGADYSVSTEYTGNGVSPLAGETDHIDLLL